MRKYYLAIFTILFAFFSLGFAYLLEYGFDILPCHLCIWQRFSYFALIIIGILLFFRKYQNILLILLYSTIFAGLALSVFQVGVEQGIFSLPLSCQADFSQAINIEDLKMMIMEEKPRCDIVNFKIFGLSLASLNIIWLLLFTAIIGYLHVYKKK